MIAVIRVRKEPYYRRAAIEAGLKRLGYAVLDKGAPSSPADVLCLWNRKRGAEEKQAEAWERAGGTVLVFENGYLQKTDKTVYAIATHQHNGAGWTPFTAAEDRFSKLGFPLRSFHGGPYVLVCGQRGVGSELMASPPQWAEKRMRELSAQGQKAKLRQHPGQFAPKIPLLDDLRLARACSIWSSGSGVRALVEGVAVEFAAPHWVCAGWERHRELALNKMAHAQWHHEEIATGEPFARMQAENWGPRWV
jgi:hypothetical protein